MTPLYNMPPHKVINVVLKAYNNIWLQTEERDFADELISALTRPRNTQLALTDDDKEAPKQLSDPLYQIIQVFQKNAVKTVANESIESDSLYLHYAELMARSCGPPEGEEEEEEEDEEDGGPDEANFQERETEKQHLIYCQQRLHERGAAEMVLQVISGRVKILSKKLWIINSQIVHYQSHSYGFHPFTSIQWPARRNGCGFTRSRNISPSRW